MKQIHKTIKSFLRKYDLEKSDLVYLVAFSGGFDSMCLLHALKKSCKNKIIAIHLNHKWRGEESDLEEQNCKNFCKNLKVEFYSENLAQDVAKTETAAREARYKFFEKCAEKFDSKIIFTAHNKNDNVETLIYRICTGTGISGLQGITEQRDIYYRPLLEITREEIENYCNENNLTPNNDSSNSDTKYKRNYIRAEVIPTLEKVNQTVSDSINSLSEIAREETEIIEALEAAIAEDTVKALMHVRIEQKVEREEVAKVTGTNRDDTVANAPVKRQAKKIMPNDLCPCGSGKKYKFCCGK